MHKLTFNRGVWKKQDGSSILNEKLINEPCPNPNCNKTYAYPHYFCQPRCTVDTCKQPLFGIRFNTMRQSRINYFLGWLKAESERNAE